MPFLPPNQQCQSTEGMLMFSEAEKNQAFNESVVMCALLQGKESRPGPPGLPGPKVCASTQSNTSCCNFSLTVLVCRCFCFLTLENHYSAAWIRFLTSRTLEFWFDSCSVVDYCVICS